VRDVPERVALVDRLVACAPSPGRLERVAAATAELLGAWGAAVTLVAAQEQVVAAAHCPVLPDDGPPSRCARASARWPPRPGRRPRCKDAQRHPWVQHLPVVVSELRAH
jgi:hypothetical protein